MCLSNCWQISLGVLHSFHYDYWIKNGIKYFNNFKFILLYDKLIADTIGNSENVTRGSVILWHSGFGIKKTSAAFHNSGAIVVRISV